MPENLLPDIAPERYYDPANWTQRHRMVVALSLAGFRNKEICEQLGYTPARVSQILSDTRAQHDRENALKELAESSAKDIPARFEEHAEDAVETLREIMTSGMKDADRLKAATGILDRAGYGPIKRELRLETNVPADPELLGRISETLKESRNSSIKFNVGAGSLADPDQKDSGEILVEGTGTDG